MQRAMDINSDVGESFGNYSFGADAEIIPHLSSVNVACGFHAGDPVHMERTVTLAKENDVAVGVHWGLPDVNGFGRREMTISTDEARCLTLYQIGALRQIASSVGATIDHLVPHGALYPMLARDEKIGGAMVDAINSVGEPWVLYWPTPLERHRFYEIAGREGIPIIHEICIDLDYRADGSLIVERVKQARDPAYIADRVSASSRRASCARWTTPTSSSRRRRSCSTATAPTRPKWSARCERRSSAYRSPCSPPARWCTKAPFERTGSHPLGVGSLPRTQCGPSPPFYAPGRQVSLSR